MKKVRVSALSRSLLWCILIVLFPIVSGTLSVVFSLDSTTTLFVQGFFMLAALIPPGLLVLTGKLSLRNVGFGKFDTEGCKKVYWFIPVLALFVPAAIKGFHIESASYVLGCLFLYLSVAVAEEVYFRGLVPHCLEKAFSQTGTIALSALVFGVGHMAAAFSGLGALQTALTVLNAVLFGWMAIEIVILSNSIVPAILFHFLFDFETKITAMGSSELFIAELARGTIMFLVALWLARVLRTKHAASRGARSLP